MSANRRSSHRLHSTKNEIREDKHTENVNRETTVGTFDEDTERFQGACEYSKSRELSDFVERENVTIVAQWRPVKRRK